MNFTLDKNLRQVVTSPSRENNFLDLVFTNVPFLVQNASILPGQTYNDMVSVEILISPIRTKQTRRKIFFNTKWTFDLINEDLEQYYTSISNDMLESLSLNDLRINFIHALSIMVEKHIPTKMISLNTNIP